VPLRRERMGGIDDGWFNGPAPFRGPGGEETYSAFNQTNITSTWALLRLLDLEIYALAFA
jgi:hypothetical protein